MPSNMIFNYVKSLNKLSILLLVTLLRLNFHKLNLVELSIKFTLANHLNFHSEIHIMTYVNINVNILAIH